MDPILMEILKVSGFPTLALVWVAYYVANMTKMHQQERMEWREDINRALERRDQVMKENNEVLRQLAKVIERTYKK